MSAAFDQALAWMRADKSRGYKRAAKQYGLHVGKLREYARGSQAVAEVETSSTESKATRAEVIAWMGDQGKGYKAAAAHFDLNVNTVKSWQRRREKENGGSFDGEDYDPGQSMGDVLERHIRMAEDRMMTVTAGQLPALSKHAVTLHGELLVMREEERIASGEFRDPDEMLDRIIKALEGNVQLLSPAHVSRLNNVVIKGLRLTSGGGNG